MSTVQYSTVEYFINPFENHVNTFVLRINYLPISVSPFGNEQYMGLSVERNWYYFWFEFGG